MPDTWSVHFIGYCTHEKVHVHVTITLHVCTYMYVHVVESLVEKKNLTSISCFKLAKHLVAAKYCRWLSMLFHCRCEWFKLVLSLLDVANHQMPDPILSSKSSCVFLLFKLSSILGFFSKVRTTCFLFLEQWAVLYSSSCSSHCAKHEILLWKRHGH